jgi:cell division protease FtsH
LIDRVRIAADGRSADFLNIEGAKGTVNLLSDPSLLKILTDNGVDIAAMPNDPTGNVFLGIFQ